MGVDGNSVNETRRSASFRVFFRLKQKESEVQAQVIGNADLVKTEKSNDSALKKLPKRGKDITPSQSRFFHNSSPNTAGS